MLWAALAVGMVLQAEPGDRRRATECLASAIAYEAGNEPLDGQQAVAEVVLNRVQDPLFPKSVCGVVFAGSKRRTGCQFTFTCDGALARRLPEAMLVRARAVAEAALDGRNPVRAFGATHYHAAYVSPYWAPSLIRVTRIGAHIFYRAAVSASVQSGRVPVVVGNEPEIREVMQVNRAGAAVATSAPPSSAATFAPWGLPLAGHQ